MLKSDQSGVSAPKRFLLADDSTMVRRVVRDCITNRRGWTVCAEAADGFDAVEQAVRLQPDCAILDFQMPRLNGIEAAALIGRACPHIAILLISMHDPELLFSRLLATAVRGFLAKSTIGSELVPAVETILGGGTYFVGRKRNGYPTAEA